MDVVFKIGRGIMSEKVYISTHMSCSIAHPLLFCAYNHAIPTDDVLYNVQCVLLEGQDDAEFMIT